MHPVHVEAVASVVGRADSLCGLFYTLALVCYTSASSGDGGPDLLRIALFGEVFGFAVIVSFYKPALVLIISHVAVPGCAGESV